MKNLLRKWHCFWFKRHTKWLLIKQKEEIYKELYKSINDYLMNDINEICVVDKPYTVDDVIKLCNMIESEKRKMCVSKKDRKYL